MSRSFVVGIAGNTHRPSRTRALVETLISDVSLRRPIDVEIHDLDGLGPELGATLDPRLAPPRLAAVLDAIVAADALVVASPVYKGTFSGLFKHLFDLVDPKVLQGKPVLIAATGGSERHSLAIDHGLRPLFGFFGAAVVPTGVYATERDFLDYQPSHTALVARIGAAAEELAEVLGSRRAARALAKSA
ncbi:FMN reductase [Methyloraptor flagellatus]|jgi:FMN reductase|uniref:FMN reductase n=1 Tax=Methyloraptor flagellatus TaxID=3162530 RepID=A0AAU7X7M9_9HYPH